MRIANIADTFTEVTYLTVKGDKRRLCYDSKFYFYLRKAT